MRGSMRGSPNRGNTVLSKCIQRADPPARQGEDQQAGGPADLTMRVMDVEPEGGLTIRPRGDQPEGASGRSDTILRKLAASSRP